MENFSRGKIKLCNSLKSPTHLKKDIFLKYYKKAQNVFKHLQHKNKDLLEFYFYIVVRKYVGNYLIFLLRKLFFLGFSETYRDIFKMQRKNASG